MEELPPLKSAELNVLLALAEGEMHGYGIRKDVVDRTGGKVKLGPGTLYRTLDSLLDRGWIEDTGIEEESEGGRRRRYYRIAGTGRKAAAVEVERLEEIVASARRRGISGRGFGPAIGETQ
jgi:DNA-binding PadR family transcriptional regulator